MQWRADRIARQQWRARIETTSGFALAGPTTASPASNGGRGLKLQVVAHLPLLLGASPASNGGRGLKQRRKDQCVHALGIARQQWRARIETG